MIRRIILICLLLFSCSFAEIVCQNKIYLFNAYCYDNSTNQTVELKANVYHFDNQTVYVLSYFDLIVLASLILVAIFLDFYQAFILICFIYAIAFALHSSTALFYTVAFVIALLILAMKKSD